MEKLKGKCAIFLDIDGTLTYHKPIPSERVIDTLYMAQKAGHKIILNTGRGYGNIYQPMLEKVKPDGIICAMGQYIAIDGEIIRNITFTEEMKRLVLGIAKKKQKGGFVEGVSDIYAVNFGSIDPWTTDMTKLKDAVDVPAEDMQKLCFVGMADEETVEALQEYFAVYQHGVYFESAIKGHTKAEGLLYVANLLGIPVENCIAVGDSANDAEMIQTAGVGVAMGNATDDLKKIAQIITETNANDGVAVILEELLEM